jgi:hypothetical protein
VDLRIAELAARQEQVLALTQLVGLGLTPRSVRGRVAARRLFRRHRGVYSLTPTVTRLGEFWAAVLACGPRAALSHESAGHVYDVRQHRWGPSHVTISGTGTRKRDGIVVHTSRVPFTRVFVDGLPVTDITRTLTDMADTLTPSAHQLAVAKAERKGLIDRGAYQRLPGRRAIMDRPHQFTRSENERALLRLCEHHGLPVPLTNQDIDGLEVDAYWPDHGLVLEIDAWFTHGNPIVFETDRAKDEQLELNHPIMVRRVTDTRLHADPDEVAGVIRVALRVAQQRRQALE